MAMSRAQGVGVDESVLAKVLLFERCGDTKAYAAMIKSVTENSQGKPVFLADWEQKVISGDPLDLKAPWDDAFIREWLQLTPQLGDRDLRGVQPPDRRGDHGRQRQVGGGPEPRGPAIARTMPAAVSTQVTGHRDGRRRGGWP